MNIKQLAAIMPYAGSRAALFLPFLDAAMHEFGIVTPEQQAAFLANVAVESGSLRYVAEIADGSAYEGRKDLGNTHPGDGPRFKGRGLLQVTGRANYEKCGKALGVDLIAHPEQLETPALAARSAGWFWHVGNLNGLADQGMFTAICKRINGGVNGLAERKDYWARAKKALDCE